MTFIGNMFYVSGCWGAAKICNQSSCVANSNRNHSYFCCCTGGMCNEDVSVPEVEEKSSALVPGWEIKVILCIVDLGCFIHNFLTLMLGDFFIVYLVTFETWHSNFLVVLGLVHFVW